MPFCDYEGCKYFDSTHIVIDEPEILDYKIKEAKLFMNFLIFYTKLILFDDIFMICV